VRALILAGGRGRRLEPYTAVLPKPLAPVGDLPIIEIVLRQLHRDGIDEVVISLGHLGELILAYFNAKPPPRSMHLEFVREQEQLGTAGPLSLAAADGETMLVINGDVLTDLRFDAVVDQHTSSGAAMTITTNRRSHPIEFGVVDTTGRRVTQIVEKPIVVHDCAMGVNVYGPQAIAVARRGGPVDFPEVVDALLRDGHPVEAFHFDGYWCDIGRRDDLLRANDEFEQRRDALLPSTEDPR
jgi:NDP-mannose synthase